MNLYSIALFLHIVGALGLFIALGLDWTSLFNLRRARTVEQAREWANLAASLGVVYAPSMLTILLSGIYMMVSAWGGVAWIVVAFLAMILLAVIGAGLSARPTVALKRAVDAESGPVSAMLSQQLRNPFLWTSIQTRVGIALGSVFLMTIKPDLVGALLAIVVAAALGFAMSLPTRGRNPKKAKDVTA